MADLDRRYAQGTTVGRTDAGVVDQGLRAYMIRVYNYMASGVAITGVVAYAIYAMSVVQGAAGLELTAFGNFMFASAFKWVVIFAPLAMVFFISARINSMSLSAAQISFWVFAALMGASISSIFLVYAGESIARVFFITAASFGALSLWGYTTSRDLSGWGSFLFMGLIGIIIASLVNLFIGSTALQFAVSVIGVLVFAGLTAYDTQQIKEMYNVDDDGSVVRPQGGDGRAQALSRLHQPVHDAAAAVRRPPLSERHPAANTAKAPAPAGAFVLVVTRASFVRARCSSLDQAQALSSARSTRREIVAALQDQPGRRDHAIGALPPRELRRLLDAVERHSHARRNTENTAFSFSVSMA